MEPELTEEEIENIAKKEEVRQKRVERYERRMKKKEVKEADNLPEDLAVQGGDVSSVRSSGIRETSKPVKLKSPQGKKSKTEAEKVEEIEEEEDEEELYEVMMKRKIGGCINKQEAGAFQNFVRDKMIVLVERM